MYVFLEQTVPGAAQLMKPGCLWIRVSRLNSLLSNEVQALIKVSPHRGGIDNNALIRGCSEARGRAELPLPPLLPQHWELPPPNPAPLGTVWLKPLQSGADSLLRSPWELLSQRSSCKEDFPTYAALWEMGTGAVRMRLQAAGQNPSNSKLTSQIQRLHPPPALPRATGSRKAAE